MRSTAGSTAPTGTAPDPSERVRRFSTAERMVHRATGLLMLVCLVSAACLYLGPLALLVGRRHLMVTVHQWSGISLPLPFLLGLLSPSFRADLQPAEPLRGVRPAVAARRPQAPEVTRGAPGRQVQRGPEALHAAGSCGAVLVMMFTGLLMWFMGLLPFISRTSAIFVHDILAWAITIVVLGHMRKAFEDPEARLGMRTGYVSRSWAQRYYSRWLGEEDRPGVE